MSETTFVDVKTGNELSPRESEALAMEMFNVWSGFDLDLCKCKIDDKTLFFGTSIVNRLSAENHEKVELHKSRSAGKKETIESQSAETRKPLKSCKAQVDRTFDEDQLKKMYTLARFVDLDDIGSFVRCLGGDTKNISEENFYFYEYVWVSLARTRSESRRSLTVVDLPRTPSLLGPRYQTIALTDDGKNLVGRIVGRHGVPVNTRAFLALQTNETCNRYPAETVQLEEGGSALKLIFPSPAALGIRPSDSTKLMIDMADESSTATDPSPSQCGTYRTHYIASSSKDEQKEGAKEGAVSLRSEATSVVASVLGAGELLLYIDASASTVAKQKPVLTIRGGEIRSVDANDVIVKEKGIWLVKKSEEIHIKLANLARGTNVVFTLTDSKGKVISKPLRLTVVAAKN
jgi:hypothetical protein